MRGSLDQPVRVRQAHSGYGYLECMLQVVFLTRHTGLVTAAIELIPMALTTALDVEEHTHRPVALTIARSTVPVRLMPPSAPREEHAFGKEHAPPLSEAGQTPSGESLECMLEGLRDVEDDTLSPIEVPDKGDDDTLSVDLDALTSGDLISLYGDGFVLLSPGRALGQGSGLKPN